MSSRLLFGELFFALRTAGIPVALTEWMALMKALSSGAVTPELVAFYQVSRAVLVKSEMQFDTFDQVFTAVFGGGKMLPTQLTEELTQWLDTPLEQLLRLSPEEVEALERLPLERLRELFEQRMREQTEPHDGGRRWVGTAGTSPFGQGGQNPGGLRVGGGGSEHLAIQIASERRFRDYRNDRVLDTRAVAVALKKLRRLSRTDGPLELDVPDTVDQTSRNAGELDLVFRPPRSNEARVLLLMDVGGSMEPHTRLVEALFSAASALNHWKSFEALTFHNCPYHTLYSSIWGRQGKPTAEVLANLPPRTFLILVGDATMAPSELTSRNGAIDYYDQSDTPGVVWLHRLRSRFPRAVWLNPLRREWWQGWTCQVIAQLFPMFPLTLGGLEDAIDVLLRRSDPHVPDLDPRLLKFDLRFS
jgi:uncharacterized protein